MDDILKNDNSQSWNMTNKAERFLVDRRRVHSDQCVHRLTQRDKFQEIMNVL